jgi:hypothetical protein
VLRVVKQILTGNFYKLATRANRLVDTRAL